MQEMWDTRRNSKSKYSKKILLEFLRQIIDMWNMRYILLCLSTFCEYEKHVTQFCASSADGIVKTHQNCALCNNEKYLYHKILQT